MPDDTKKGNVPDDIQIDLDKSEKIADLLDEVVSEGTVSSENPDPESDDDMVENAHDMGLYLDDDGDNPKELNIAQEIENAEKAHRDK